MLDFSEVDDGEQWELFARDFLRELGYTVEVSPDRGPDGGRDLLVTEDLVGNLTRYEFRWLVSCKNFATSGKSVSETDEPNIIERLQSFSADGFMGFYSTVPSSGLNSRLHQLKDGNNIGDFQIFDSRVIENYLVRVGYSKLMMRYFPDSYRSLRPLHQITNKYLPLECETCGKDLLAALSQEGYAANLVYVKDTTVNDKILQITIEDIYWACKGECDRTVEARITETTNLQTGWQDISDLVIPVWFLRWFLTTMNRIRGDTYTYSDKAYEKVKDFGLAMSQKVLREMTEKERERVIRLIDLSQLQSL